MFQFEKELVFGPGEQALLDQVCLATGFSRFMLPQYFTGEEPSLMDNYPGQKLPLPCVFH